jgi:hypothetical protein
MLSGQDRSPDEIKEYVRLFERFQRLRPDDGPDEIAKLIDLVENGTLKEECGSFVVRTSEEDYEMDQAGNRSLICGCLCCRLGTFISQYGTDSTLGIRRWVF